MNKVPPVLIVLTVMVWGAVGAAAEPRYCGRTTDALERACRYEAIDDFYRATAICINEDGFRSCVQKARLERDATFANCDDISDARQEVCDAVGEAAYQPEFGEEFAHQFVDPNAIGSSVAPNPFLPLVRGARWVYRKKFTDDEGEPQIETVTVVVTNRTKLVDGILCRVVRDIVKVDDDVVEDTDDWFAQDVAGNVWYCGEEVKDYEEFEGDRPEAPELVSLDGSFKAGREGDKAGIIMFAHPQVGTTYREEASWGNAEDLSEVLSTTASEQAVGAQCRGDCLKLRAFSPLEPGIDELKFYAPNIGNIVTFKPSTGERSELVEFHIPR